MMIVYLRPVPAKDSHQMTELHEKELYLWVLSFAIPRWQCGLNKNNAFSHSGLHLPDSPSGLRTKWLQNWQQRCCGIT